MISDLRKSWLRPLALSCDMLRKRGFVLLTIYNCITHISTGQIIYTDGWIPLTHNAIYDQMSTEFPVYQTAKPPMDYKNTFNLDQRKFNSRNDLTNFKPSLELFSEKYRNFDKFMDQTDNSDPISMTRKENARKSKMVPDDNFDYIFNNVLGPLERNSTILVDKKIYNLDVNLPEGNSNTYEVTEDTDKSITEDENSVNEFAGYQYNPPSDENQNLTSAFHKILSKYNIKSNDRLQNYDLSLRRRAQNPLSVYQVPSPYRYNSLNHLPVNPLLAVFLSNYGFYLPSLYGIKSNYNNLYGYLASNNIHNNKPFGSYKIFSDTDSSN